MRKKEDLQLTFVDSEANWTRAQDLRKMDEILRENDTLVDFVWQDLTKDKKHKSGRPGMNAIQVLRVAIVKSLYQLPYRDLEDRLSDSIRLRSFCGFGDSKIPSHTILASNVKRISAATWESINQALVKYALACKVETGKRIRMDATSTDCNVHRPTDSRLLGDVVRVLTRLLAGCEEYFGSSVVGFNNRTRAVKRRVFKIANCKSEDKRKNLYRDLLNYTDEVVRMAKRTIEKLNTVKGSPDDFPELREQFSRDLTQHIAYGHQIIEQTERRVFKAETVPAEEKLFSIFEDHTDLVRKGGRNDHYGHKVYLTGGSSSMILDCQIARGNPSDSEMYLPSLERIEEIIGKVPVAASADDGFSSLANGNAAKERGIKEVVFGGKLKTELAQWVTNARVQKQLRRFRSGIEGIISAVKRAFGLDRCTWTGWDGFCKYVWSAIVAWNLQVMSRVLLSV